MPVILRRPAAMLSVLLLTLALVLPSTLAAAEETNPVDGPTYRGDAVDNQTMIYVCKYRQKPGSDQEVLKGGKNPIQLNAATVVQELGGDFTGELVGQSWTDGQFRSEVVADDTCDGPAPVPTVDIRSGCTAPQSGFVSASVTGAAAGQEFVLTVIAGEFSATDDATADEVDGDASLSVGGLADGSYTATVTSGEETLATSPITISCPSTPIVPVIPQEPEPEPVPVPVVEPAVLGASAEQVCTPEGLLEVTYRLDNSDSDTATTFTVQIGAASSDVTLEAGETRDLSFTIAPEDGDVGLLITDPEREVLFAGEFNAEDCVLPPEPEIEEEPVVLDEVEEQPDLPVEAAEKARLATTGIPALLLTLLGLLGLGLGGGMLAAKRE